MIDNKGVHFKIASVIVESGLKPIHSTDHNHGLKAVVIKISLNRALAHEEII